MRPLDPADPPPSDGPALGWRLAAVQCFLTVGWALYVIFLPDLLGRAGIEAGWTLWILLADQLIFAFSDVAFGIAADRVADSYRRLVGGFLAVTVVSAAAFLLLPWAAWAGPGLFLGLVAVWAISGSVLRAPTLVLLCRRTREAQRSRHLAAYAAGMAAAGCISPYLGIVLKGLDPRLPFALSSVALVVAAVALAGLPEPCAGAPAQGARSPRPVRSVLPFLVASLVAAMGFQVHFSMNAAPRFLAVAPRDQLPWLMPLFWIGFNLAMPLAEPLVRRLGALRTAAIATGAAGIGAAFSTQVADLGSLGVLQAVTGGAWGLAFVAMLEWVADAGSHGREGSMLGGFFAILALATVIRMLAVALQWPGQTALKDLLPMLPAVLFTAAALLLLAMATARPRQAERMPGP